MVGLIKLEFGGGKLCKKSSRYLHDWLLDSLITQVGLMRDGKLLAQAKPDYLIHSYGMSVCSCL